MSNTIDCRNDKHRDARRTYNRASRLRRQDSKYVRGRLRGRPVRPLVHCPAPGPRTRGTAAPVASAVICRLDGQEVQIALQPCTPGSGSMLAYAALQCCVYGQHGVQRAQRVSDGCLRSCTHLILARRADGTLAGGLRIHARARGPLPVEAALPRSRRLPALLDRLGNPMELSGMVVVAEARKTGLAALLARAAVAAIPLLAGRAAVGFGHQHVLPLYASVGFAPRRRLGCHHYPDARYRSRIAVLEDAVTLPGVAEDERLQITSLRQRLIAGQAGPMSPEGVIR